MQALNKRLYALEDMVTEAEAREDRLAEKMRITVKDLIGKRLAEHQHSQDLSAQLATAHESFSQLKSSFVTEKAKLGDVTAQLLAAQNSLEETLRNLNQRDSDLALAEAELLYVPAAFSQLFEYLRNT